MILITDLPPEIQTHILRHVRDLNPSPPSVAKFAHEPSLSLTDLEETPLKNCSLVCQQWRAFTVRLLFTNSRIKVLALDARDWGPPELPTLINRLARYLKIIKALGLRRHVKSLTLIIRPASFDQPKKNKAMVRVPVWGKEPGPFAPWVVDGLDGLWTSIFGWLPCLETIGIAAQPEMLAALLMVNTYMPDAWAFNIPLQYARLSLNIPDDDGAASTNLAHAGLVTVIEPHPPSENEQKRALGEQSFLLDVKCAKPWRHVGMNEGALINVHARSVWEFYTPPKTLRHLLDAHLKLHKALCYTWSVGSATGPSCQETFSPRSPTVRPGPAVIESIEHISLFPYRDHIGCTWKFRELDDDDDDDDDDDNDDNDDSEHTNPLPNLRFLTVKYADADLIASPERLGKSNPEDVWKHWESSWCSVMKRVARDMSTGATLRINDSGLAARKHFVFKDDKGAEHDEGIAWTFRECWRLEAESENEMVWVKTRSYEDVEDTELE